MYIKRRNCEHARIKRNNRKSKPNESFLSSFGTSFKVLAIWAIILMLDFFTDFRFEFLYSCWLFVRTVLDSFRFQGLAFALFFTLIAMTSDIVCYFLIPATLVHLLGSSFVWFQLIWQADRGFYGPTVVLCFLFVYVEIAVRLRDPKALPLGIDICRPFAAHCVGYPAVTLGFVLKTMVSHHFRVRKQRSVEAQNMTFFALLEEALPKDLRVFLKTEESPPKVKPSALPAHETPVPTSGPSTTNRGAANKEKSNTVGRKQLSPSSAALNTSGADSSVQTSVHSDVCVCSPDGRISSTVAEEIGSSMIQTDSSRTFSNLGTESPEFSELGKTSDYASHGLSTPDALSWSVRSELEHGSSGATQESQTFADSVVDSCFASGPKAPSSVSSTTSSSSSTAASSVSGSLQTTQRSNLTGQRVDNGASNRLRCGSKPVLPAEGQPSTKGPAQLPTVMSTGSATSSNQTTASSGAAGGGASNKSTTTGSHKPNASANAKGSQKDEYTLKLEAEVKQLKSELQSLRSLEIELRGQVQQLTAAERTYRSESSQARQEAEVLQTKLEQLTLRLETDRASLQTAEKRLAEERKQRSVLEQQLAVQNRSTKQAGKGHKDLGSGAEPLSQSNVSIGHSKYSNVKAAHVNGLAQGTVPSADLCPGGESNCATRLRELECELRTLTAELSSKESALASLNTHPRISTVDQAVYTEPEVTSCCTTQPDNRTDELLAKLHCLQEENQRMTDTLKEEDKMKQELMTAYHTALKEITELNSSLTKKEYQIVELNMRLEALTPQLCEFVNAMNLTTKAAPQSTVVDYTLDHHQPHTSSYSAYLSDQLAASPYDSTTGVKDMMRRVLPDGHLYPDSRRSAGGPVNGCASIPESVYSSSIYNSSVYDLAGDSFPQVDNSAVYSRFPTRCATQTDYTGVSGGFSVLENTLFSQAQTGQSANQHHQQLPMFGRFPTRSVCNPQTPQFDLLDASHQAVYPQSTRYKSLVSSPPASRPLPVGSAAVSASSPPPPPPGLMNRGSTEATSSSYSRGFRRPHSSSHLAAPALEVVVTSAALLCSSAGLDLYTSGPSPSSLNSLIESLSPLGRSPSSNHNPTTTIFSQLKQPSNVFCSVTSDQLLPSSMLLASDRYHLGVDSDSDCYRITQSTTADSDSLDVSNCSGLTAELGSLADGSRLAKSRNSPPDSRPPPQTPTTPHLDSTDPELRTITTGSVLDAGS